MATQTLTEEATSKYAQAGDIRIHFNEAGTGDPVICIHGGGPGAAGWSNYVANVGPLSEHFPTILTDMPGYGKSDPVTLTEGRLSYNAKALNHLLDSLGLEKASFIGNSMGGGTSAKFAIEYPEQVDKLILMGAAGGGTSLFSPMPVEGIRMLGTVRDNPTVETFREMIRLFVYDSSFVTDELLEQRVQGYLSHPEHIAAARNSTAAGVGMDLTADLHKITAKTLVIWGRDDRFVPLDHALKFMWHIPNAQVHIFPECGHWAQYEHAEEFNRLVIDFLSH